MSQTPLFVTYLIKREKNIFLKNIFKKKKEFSFS